MIELFVPGIPTSVNATRRRSWHVVVEEVRILRKAAHYAAIDAMTRSAGPFPIRPASVEYVFCLAAARGDLDNLVAASKPILDGIVSAKLLAEDNVRALPSLSATWRRASEPGVLVRIKEAEL